MRRALLPAAVVLALVVAPAARLVAAAPCSGTAQMDCCSGMDDEAVPPCNCSLNPVPPAPAFVDAAQIPAIVLAEAPLPAIAAEAPATAGSAARIAPRARPAPLFLLFAVFLI